MAKRVAWATERIAHLAENARSESVRLAALRSILSDIMAVSDFAGLEERIAKLEEQDRVRAPRKHELRGLRPAGVRSRPG